MTDQITINGVAFDVTGKYAEGHPLTANEASALNQTYFENLRNNFASKVKAAKEAAGGADLDQSTLDTLQTEFDTYAASYEFGVRLRGGGGSAVRLDPVTAEARSLAREKITAAIRDKGGKVKDYTKEQIDTMIDKYLAKYPETLDLARERVDQKKAAVANFSLDDITGDVAAAAATAPTDGQPTSSKRGAKASA